MCTRSSGTQPENIDVEIPRDSLTVITGLSGSGKSSLAFDTLFVEGQRRYIETFSATAAHLGGMERPDVDKITGLSPVISIEQKTTNKNPRSTVGTTTEIYDYLRLLFARAGTAYSYLSGEKMVKYTEEQILDLIHRDYKGNAFISWHLWCVRVKDITRNCSSRYVRRAISMYV